MKHLKLLFLFCAGLSSPSLFAGNFGEQKLDQIVAIVNDDVITQNELNRQFALIKRQLTANKAKIPGDDALRKQVLNQLIDVDLQTQLAKKANITVSEEQVTHAIEVVARNNHVSLAQLQTKISAHGMNYNDYRANIRKELVINELQQQALNGKIKVTAEEVTEYLKTHSSPKDGRLVYHVQDILIPLADSPTSEQVVAAKAKADQLADKLNKGADFGETAIAESSDHTALHGGDLGWRSLAELPEVFSVQVKKMAQGQISGPIRAANGYHIIKVAEVRTATGVAQSPTDPRQVQQYLYARHFTEAVESWLQDVRAQAFIKIV